MGRGARRASRLRPPSARELAARPPSAPEPTGQRAAAWHEDRHRPVADGTQGLVDRIAIIDAVRGLPLRQREVVVLRFFGDLSVSDTAAAIGSSEGTVKTHTSRALLALRGTLTEDAIQSTMPKGSTLC